MIRVPLLCVVFVLVAACGQKGDLYLPDREREVIATLPTGATTAPPATAADDDEENQASPAAAEPATSGAAQ